jgi:hypothetical protein
LEPGAFKRWVNWMHSLYSPLTAVLQLKEGLQLYASILSGNAACTPAA